MPTAPPVLLRLVHSDDLNDLYHLAELAGYGLTTLPADRGLLQERIEASLSGQTRLFVLEDTTSKRVIGTSGITRSVGTDEPWYAYRLEHLEHASHGLGIQRSLRVLHLHIIRDGPSEIGSLFLSPNARRGGVGRFLSLARFLYVAENRTDFQDSFLTELRGVVDETG